MAEFQRSRSAAGRSALRCRTVVSMEAARVSSRLSRARPYLSATTSPCSVILMVPSTVPHGCAGIASAVGPPPRPTVPPRPWKKGQLHARFRGHRAQPAQRYCVLDVRLVARTICRGATCCGRWPAWSRAGRPRTCCEWSRRCKAGCGTTGQGSRSARLRNGYGRWPSDWHRGTRRCRRCGRWRRSE